MNGKISIITPMYNSSEFIDDYFESILKQKYTNFEIIIIDDASSDNSWEICKKYEVMDKRIKLFKNAKNMGASATRNRALELATGEFITFIDSDDTIEEDMLSFLINRMETTVDIVYCGVGIKGERQKKKIQKEFDREKALQYFLSIRLIGGFAAGKLYRAEVLKNIKFKEDMRVGEDGIFSLNALWNARKIIYTNIPLYNYNYRENSLSMHNEFSERRFDDFLQLKYAKEIIKSNRKMGKYYKCFCFSIMQGLLNEMQKFQVQNKYVDQYEKVKIIMKQNSLATFMYSKNYKNRIKALKYWLYSKLN